MATKKKDRSRSAIDAILTERVPATIPAPRTLNLEYDLGQQKGVLARAAADPITRNVIAANDYTHHLGEVDYAEAIVVLNERAKAINAGDLKHAEAVLIAQADTLDAIFTSLAKRAVAEGVSLTAGETYLRVALKAQSQSRATIETLVSIKNPSLVFARQANIAYGHQQVNNNESTSTRRVRKKRIPRNELLD